jgi:linker histone H1 and H5 family/Williams-Beuren syndrome DDT (WSD), D-TOX E motif
LLQSDVEEETKNSPSTDNDPAMMGENSVIAHDDIEKENESDTYAKPPAKKTPTKKPPSKSPASPKISYVALVQEAIENMNDRTGSSQIAIQKYIVTNHPEVPAEKLRQRLLITLKAGCANKRFIKVKASFKIHPEVLKKKAAQKKIGAKKDTDRKSLSKEDLAALREKERLAAKEKERLELIRKRKFPMDDIELIKEDKELKVSVTLPPRPSLPLALPEFPSMCKSDTMGSGLLDDAFHVYHFFRGDVGWGRFAQQRSVVAPFTLHQWLECILQVLRGGAKKSRMLPPLMTHLFVVALQHLVPKELQAALTPSSWSEVLMLYMDAMERYYTTEASLDTDALPGVGIDTAYLFHISDQHKDESSLTPPTGRESNFYLQSPLDKIQDKLFTNDPWMLGAEELLALLKALVDDLLATTPSCSEELDFRLQESFELLKTKREADALYRKLQILRKKEENEKKESEDQGEKPTRSNLKLPSVSDAKLESARRSQLKATEAYEKACRSKRVRTEPIGDDRYFNTFFHFWSDPERVYVAHRNKALATSASFNVPGGSDVYRTIWHSIDKRSVLEKYIESLDTRGKREYALKEGLEVGVKSVYDDIKAINEKKAILKGKQDLQAQLENARLKCEVGRKSGRLAAQSEQEFFDLQEEIQNLEKLITGYQDEPANPDLELATGLAVLREFEQRDETSQRRRSTTRGGLKQEEVDGENRHLAYKCYQCSKLWSTGNIDGTGVVGSIVWDLLELEERMEILAPWDMDRQKWISALETASHSWHAASPPLLEVEKGASNISKGSPGEPGSEAKKQRRMSTDGNSQSVHQVLTMVKVCIWSESILHFSCQD